MLKSVDFQKDILELNACVLLTSAEITQYSKICKLFFCGQVNVSFTSKGNYKTYVNVWLLEPQKIQFKEM